MSLAVLQPPKLTFVAQSPQMRKVLDQVNMASQSNCAVLVLGETGTGKDLVAKLIHQQSPRAGKPFIRVNCGAIPEALFESELFGYGGGAFTGAKREGKKGLVKAAEGGTLFLDEIGDLPLNSQVKLLHLLQDQVYTPLGETTSIKANIRILAATNQDLESLIRQGRFRKDLYYRLKVITIHIPPLREQREQIPELIRVTASEIFGVTGKKQKRFTSQAMELLLQYDWPGNVRELKSVVEQLFIYSRDREEITVDDVALTLGNNSIRPNNPEPKILVNGIVPLQEAIESLERQLLGQALSIYKTTTAISKVLGVSQPTIVRKIAKYNLKRTSYKIN